MFRNIYEVWFKNRASLSFFGKVIVRLKLRNNRGVLEEFKRKYGEKNKKKKSKENKRKRKKRKKKNFS